MHHSDSSVRLKEEEIFQHAAELLPTERPSYLSAACAGDPAVRARIERLLRLHEDRDFMGARAERTNSSSAGSESLRWKPEQVGERIGNYKLLEQIGEGGFGVVWAAEQEKPVRRRVALKIIKLGMDTREVIARFEQERQALAMMDHPNIAKVLDAGTTPLGRPFFVMELVSGTKITEYCDQAKLPTEERLRLFIAVCNAVQHAHQKGIIHRDLKPSNILVTLHDGVPAPKVIDFGVAKATQRQLLTDLTVYTQFEQMIGTPLYMSPEQAEMTGLDIDTRSDIYSLGVLLYELLVGRTPFDPQALMKAGFDEMRRVIREEEPQKPSTFISTMAADLRTKLLLHRGTDSARLVGQIRGDLDWIVMKALEKDRTRRYETANGFAQDIQRHLVSEPVQARPATQLYRLRRFAKRNKVIFVAGSAVVAALLIGLAVSTWMFFKEKRTSEQAIAAEKAQTQVSKFLEDMLEGVGPSVALGRDTKMLREILDNTAEQVGKDLKDQPAVEAQLRSTLGNVYHELGDYEKAGAMHTEALRIRRKLFGIKHLEVAASLNNLSCVLQRQGKLEAAEAMHREVLMLYRKLLGNENPDVANALTNLAITFRLQGRLADAEKMQREALAMNRKLFGNEHKDVAITLNNLGTVLENEGKLAEAETVHREALAMQRKLLGPEHPDVVKSLTNLTNVLCGQKRLAEAETTQLEALALLRKLSGNEHPLVATALNNLANVLKDQGKLTEAETTHREGLTVSRKMLGNVHPEVVTSLTNLADVLRRQSKFAEAETTNREALQIARKVLAADHPELAQLLFDLALSLQTRGEPIEAEPLMREALVILRQVLPNGDRRLAMPLGTLGRILEAQAKYAEAETFFREAYAISRKLPGNERAVVVPWQLNLTGALEKQGKLADAETIQREALEAARNLTTPDLAQLEARLYDLAENLYRQSNFPEAESLSRELIESRKASVGAEHDTVLGPISRLARVLTDWAWAERGTQSELGNPNSEVSRRAIEAERLSRDCLAIRLRTANETDWTAAEFRSRLGGALVAVAATDRTLGSEVRTSKFAEAESLMLKGNDVLQQSRKVETKYKRDALVRLVRLYQAWDNKDKRAEWQQKLADFDEVEARNIGSEGKPIPPQP